MPRVRDIKIKSVSVYLNPNIYDLLVNLANKNKRSISQQAAFMIENNIAEDTAIKTGKTQIDPSLARG